jgi:stage III sporulation protein SpoIIIAA
MTRKRITDNLDVLLNVLPPTLAGQLESINRSDELMEVILDLGRIPTAGGSAQPGGSNPHRYQLRGRTDKRV